MDREVDSFSTTGLWTAIGKTWNSLRNAGQWTLSFRFAVYASNAVSTTVLCLKVVMFTFWLREVLISQHVVLLSCSAAIAS